MCYYVESDLILNLSNLKFDQVRQHYGIYIIALWSLILGAQNLTNLIILSASVRDFIPVGTSGWIIFYQIVSTGFSLAFFAATVGLWRLKLWGRRLFLVTAILFFLVSTVGIFTAQQDELTITEKGLFTLRYFISILLPLIYLNLAHVTAKFQETQKGSSL